MKKTTLVLGLAALIASCSANTKPHGIYDNLNSHYHQARRARRIARERGPVEELIDAEAKLSLYRILCCELSNEPWRTQKYGESCLQFATYRMGVLGQMLQHKKELSNTITYKSWLEIPFGRTTTEQICAGFQRFSNVVNLPEFSQSPTLRHLSNQLSYCLGGYTHNP